MQANTTGNFNTAIGVNALVNSNADNNTASGYNALSNNTSGFDNTATGASALNNNTTGLYNTATGVNALYHNNGDNNTATGVDALATNSTGSNNTATGSNALSNNTTGTLNTAIGVSALLENVDGSNNTAIGLSSLQNNTDGQGNLAIGNSSLLGNTSGGNNTAVGYSALANATGGNNIALGSLAGFNVTTGSGNIHIGTAGASNDDLVIEIGDPNVLHQTRIAGIWDGITGNLSGVTQQVLVDNRGQLGTVMSSRRYKDDIADMNDASAALMKLRPVTFHYKVEGIPTGRILQYGLIAEEVDDVYPGLVVHSPDGKAQTVMYQFLPPMLLNEYQKQQRTIEAHAAETSRQAAVMSQQTKHIADLERDRQIQTARIDLLEYQTAEIAALKRQVEQLVQLQARTASPALAAGE